MKIAYQRNYYELINIQLYSTCNSSRRHNIILKDMFVGKKTHNFCIAYWDLAISMPDQAFTLKKFTTHFSDVKK